MPVEAEYWAETLNRATAEHHLRNELVLKSSKTIPTKYKKKTFSIFDSE